MGGYRMKNIATFVIAALMLVSAVAATTTTLSDEELTMALVDVKTVEFCISNNAGPMDVAVVIAPICRDLDSQMGCQAGDDMTHPNFNAVPVDATTGADGCVDLTLTTNVPNEASGGIYYYTVNGKLGEATLGSETGMVFVPEFGIVAAVGALAGAGYFIARKRK
jgi:hypothetical protein